MHKATPAEAIFGRDMLFDIPFVSDCKGVHGVKADFSKWLHGLDTYFANSFIYIQLRILCSLVM